MKRFFALLMVFCSACAYGPCDEDEGLRTVPVTNRPGIVPDHGGGIPGVGSGSPH